MDLSALLMSGLTGAVTGYITNDVAVRMLFRSYGPFGGVLESTREEFIINMSQLVEDEIINYETISGELESPRVRQEINRFITEVVSVQLQEKFENMCWYELPGWEKSSRGLADMVSEEEFISDLLTAGAENIDFSDIMGEEQLERVLDKIMTAGAEILQKDENADELAGLLASMIINLHDPEQAAGLTREEILKLLRRLSAHRGRLKKLLQELLAELNISSRAEEEIMKLLDRPLSDWADNSSLSGSRELLIDFLEKPEGEELFKDIVKAVGSALEEVELTLPELLGDSWQQSVLPLLKKRLPDLLEALLDWLEENKQDLESIIDRAIEEVLSAGSGLRNQLKNILFRALQGNVARRYGILNRIIRNLSQDGDRTRLAHQFTRQFAELLEEKTVGWFFYQLKNLDIVNWRLVYQLLLRFLREGELLPGAEEITLPSLKPSAFMEAEEFSGKLAAFLPELASDLTVNLLLMPELGRGLSSILHDNLPDYLSSANAVESLSSALKKSADLLAEEEGRLDAGILHKLTPLLHERISALELQHLLQPLYGEELISSLQNLSRRSMNDFFHEFRNREIKESLDRIVDIPDYQDRLTDFSMELLEENLSLLLEDRVSQAVSDNLLNLSAEDMRRVVEEFMGRELKPLTYFGGFLGFIAGLLLETAGGGLMAAAGGTSRLGISMLVYGLVGFITNVTAIRMIFRPHSEIRFAGRRLPFTPGLIARNQERFATALGEFVEDDLLNPRRMSKLFQENRSHLEAVVNESMSRDDYRSLRMILRISSDSFAARLQELAVNQLGQASSRAADFLAAEISSSLNTGLVLQKGSRVMESLAGEKPDEFQKLLAGIIAETGEVEMNFDRLTAGAGEMNIIEGLLEMPAPNLSAEGLSRLVEELIKAAGRVRAEDLISRPRRKQLEEFLLARVLHFLRGDKLGDLLKSLESDLFEGSLSRELIEIMPDLVRDNLSSLLDVILERIISFLSSNREDLKDMAAEIVEEEIERSESEGGLVGGLLMKGAYRLTDGRGTVRDIIDDLIDNRLPPYMQQSREEIGRKLEPVLLDVSEEISRELLTGSDPEGWAELAAEISSRPGVVENLQRFVHRFSTLFWQMEFSPEFLLAGADSFRSGLMADIVSSCSVDMGKDDDIEAILAELLEIPLAELKQQLSPARLLAILTGIRGQDEQDIKYLLAAGESDLSRTAAGFFRSTARTIEAGEMDEKILSTSLFSRDLLAEEIGLWLDQLDEYDELNREIESALADFLHRSSARLPRYLSPATVDFLLAGISEAGMDGLEIHFQSLLESVAVKETAVKEVEEMDPAAIEELFQSFAGRYLNRLKFYGLSGSFFGLLAELFTFMTPG